MRRVLMAMVLIAAGGCQYFYHEAYTKRPDRRLPPQIDKASTDTVGTAADTTTKTTSPPNSPN